MMTIHAPTDSIPSDPNAHCAIQRTIRRRTVREICGHIAAGMRNVVPGMEGDVMAEAARLGAGSYWTDDLIETYPFTGGEAPDREQEGHQRGCRSTLPHGIGDCDTGEA